jgi:UDP:flavonoid glycosyltransferase YjiC (YdhE family)
MRVLLTTQPGHGHFRPLLPIGNALLDAGHEVRVGASAQFGPVVEREGLSPAAVGRDWFHGADEAVPSELRDPPTEVDSLATYFAWKFVRMTAGELARDVIDLADRWRPDLIVRETTEYGGQLAAAALGVPVAAVQVATPTLMSPEVLAEVAVALDELRAGLGLPPDPAMTALADELILCFAPPALHDPSVSLPSGLCSFHPGRPPTNEPRPEALVGLAVDRPLVYATLGTTFTDPEVRRVFFPAIQAGLGDAAVDVLMTVGPTVDPADLGEQRAGVHVASYVPQRAVLDHCSVVISHGGYGTLLDAIDAAVPPIIIPFGADQFLNAATVQRLGIGLVIEQAALSAATVREAVDRLLDPGCFQRRRIEALRDEWRTLPGPDRAVESLVALANSVEGV